MTRFQEKQLALAMQQSTETSLDSSFHPSTGVSSMAAWSRDAAPTSDKPHQGMVESDEYGLKRYTSISASAATTVPEEELAQASLEKGGGE